MWHVLEAITISGWLERRLLGKTVGNRGPWLPDLVVTAGKLTQGNFCRNFYEG